MSKARPRHNRLNSARALLAVLLTLASTSLGPISPARATAPLPTAPVTTFSCPGGGSYDVDANGVASRGGAGQYQDPTGAIVAAGNCAGNVVLDASVRRIEEFGFESAPLTGVTLPSGLVSIGNAAFAYTGLTALAVPNSVTTIGTSALLGAQLTSLTLGTSVTSIGNSAFKDAVLTSLTIPSSVTSIGSSAFRSSVLTALDIPSSVTTIGASAFLSSPLASLTVRSSTLTVGASAFSGTSTSNLQCFNAPGGVILTNTALTSAALPVACGSHQIATTVGANGTIRSIPGYVPDGATPTYVFDPASGYVVDRVLVDSVDVTGSLVAVSGQSVSYTFDSVTTNRSLSVTFKVAAAPTPTPTPTPTPSPSQSTSSGSGSAPEPVVTPTPTVSPTASPTPTGTPTPTPSPTAQPTQTPTPISLTYHVSGFEKGSSAITPATQQLLVKVAAVLATATKVTITGYTESPKATKAEVALAAKRARVVRSYLLKKLGKNVQISTTTAPAATIGKKFRAVRITVQR